VGPLAGATLLRGALRQVSGQNSEHQVFLLSTLVCPAHQATRAHCRVCVRLHVLK
jgi:hypothetical protein